MILHYEQQLVPANKYVKQVDNDISSEVHESDQWDSVVLLPYLVMRVNLSKKLTMY